MSGHRPIRRDRTALRASRTAAFVALAAAVAVSAGGCPGELEDPEVFRTSCANVETKWFPNTCAFDTCHSASDRAASLDLETPGLSSRIADALSFADGKCANKPLANPQNPKGSLLYQKLAGNAGCGDRMPSGGTAFSEQELECIAKWIGSLTGSGTGGTGTGAGGSSSSGTGGTGGSSSSGTGGTAGAGG